LSGDKIQWRWFSSSTCIINYPKTVITAIHPKSIFCYVISILLLLDVALPNGIPMSSNAIFSSNQPTLDDKSKLSLWSYDMKQKALKCFFSLLDDNSKKDESNSTDWRQLFREHGIQPDVIRRIPTDRLEVLTQSDGSRIETGSTISLKDINEMPKFRWKSDPKKLYSLFMLNPDVPSRREAYEVFTELFLIFNQQNDYFKRIRIISLKL